MRAWAKEHEGVLHGFLTLRLTIEPDGRVGEVRPLCDRVMPLSADKGRPEPFRRRVLGLLSETFFPAAAGRSELTLPVIVGK